MRSDDHTDKKKKKKNYKLSSVLFLPGENSILHTAEQMKNNRALFFFFTALPICLEILHVASVFIRVGLEKQNTVSTLESLPLIFTPKSL